MKFHPGSRLLAVPALMLVIAALGLSACGSGGSGAAKTTPTTTKTASAAGSAGGAFAAGRAKLLACLKAHGVTLPARPRTARRPGPSGQGGPFGGGRGGGFFGGGVASNPKAANAFRACAASAGFGRFRSVGAGRFRPRYSTATLTAFARCVKQHGFTLPAPNTSGRGPIFPRSIERNAKFQAAARSCEGILAALPRRLSPGAGGAPPGGGGARGGAGTSTTSAT